MVKREYPKPEMVVASLNVSSESSYYKQEGLESGVLYTLGVRHYFAGTISYLADAGNSTSKYDSVILSRRGILNQCCVSFFNFCVAHLPVKRNSRFFISDMHVPNKKSAISSLYITGKCNTQKKTLYAVLVYGLVYIIWSYWEAKIKFLHIIKFQICLSNLQRRGMYKCVPLFLWRADLCFFNLQQAT